MASETFCAKCGTEVAFEGDAFCRQCGAALDRTSPVTVAPIPAPIAPAPAIVVPPITSPTPITYHRPAWPWLMLLLGLGVAAYWGSQAVVQNATVVRYEQSAGVKAAEGLQVLGRLLPGADLLGTAVDPRRSQEYTAARNALASDPALAVLGSLLAIVGLTAAMVAAPTATPSSGNSSPVNAAMTVVAVAIWPRGAGVPGQVVMAPTRRFLPHRPRRGVQRWPGSRSSRHQLPRLRAEWRTNRLRRPGRRCTATIRWGQ